MDWTAIELTGVLQSKMLQLLKNLHLPHQRNKRVVTPLVTSRYLMRTSSNYLMMTMMMMRTWMTMMETCLMKSWISCRIVSTRAVHAECVFGVCVVLHCGLLAECQYVCVQFLPGTFAAGGRFVNAESTLSCLLSCLLSICLFFPASHPMSSSPNHNPCSLHTA